VHNTLLESPVVSLEVESAPHDAARTGEQNGRRASAEFVS
jgi:hypothetical protein